MIRNCYKFSLLFFEDNESLKSEMKDLRVSGKRRDQFKTDCP